MAKWCAVVIGLLLIAVVVGFTYREGVTLPFYSDDMYHFRWVETHSARELLLPPDTMTSYRPLTFLLWYLWRHLVGFYSTAGLYAINLLLHVANGWMVFALAQRLSTGSTPGQRRWFSWTAAFIFVLFPFSYQAVLWVGSLTHVLGAFLILLAILLYDCGRRRGWGWLVAAWLVGLLPPFANEAGLILFGLVMLYEGAASHLRSRRHLLLALPYLLGPAFYLVIWLGWRKNISVGLLEGPTQTVQLLHKTAYFAQGATFPFQFVTARLDIPGDWTDRQALGLAVALALVVLGLLYARLSWWRRLALALGWVALTVLPPWLTLSAPYVETAPRLLYTASAGVACLWGGAVVGLQALAGSHRGAPAAGSRGRVSSSSRRVALVLGIAALALILLPSLVFLRQRMKLYTVLARPAWQAVDVARSSPDAAYLFVNMPEWIAYKDTTFPVGTEGVAFVPNYVGISDFIWVNTGLDVQAREVIFANVQSDQPYWFGTWGKVLDWEAMDRAVRSVDRVYITLYRAWDARLVEAGSVGGTAPEGEPLARFDGGVLLQDVQAIPEPDGLTAVLVWSVPELADVGDSVFVHLIDGEGKLVGQADGLALANMYPFWICQAGDVVRDVRWMPVSGRLLSGEYALRVGLYDVGTGERRAVWDATGMRFTDDVVLAAVTRVTR